MKLVVRRSLPAVDRHSGPRAHRRWGGRLPMVAAAGLATLWGMYSSSPSTGADGGMQSSIPAGTAAPTLDSPPWSTPRVLARCALAGGPRVAFPSEGPTRPTGDGAIFWVSHPTPCGSPASPSAPWGLSVAALGSNDQPKLAGTQLLKDGTGLGLAAVGASFGRVAVAVWDSSSASADGAIALMQGRANDPSTWSKLLVGSDPPLALTRAYLGDAAIAAVAPGPAIAVRVERHLRSDFGQPRLIPIRAGRVTALTAAMDYRSDVLLAWQQDGSIYACMVRASGRPDAVQHIGPSAPYPQLGAVVSDNGHGMIAWSSTELPRRSTARTRTYLSLSAAPIRFGAPRLLASFADPQRLGRSPGSLALVRLSTENVLLAWTVAEHGHYLIRAAPAVFAASKPRVVSDPHSQAILSDLAPGPAGEAIALWRTAPRLAGGALDMRRAELWTARASIRPHAHVELRNTEMIAAAGPNLAPAIAVDPANDQAVAAWLSLGAQRRIEYAVGPGAADYRRHARVAAAGRPAAGLHWLRITLAAVVFAAGLAALALASRHRRRLRQP